MDVEVDVDAIVDETFAYLTSTPFNSFKPEDVAIYQAQRHVLVNITHAAAEVPGKLVFECPVPRLSTPPDDIWGGNTPGFYTQELDQISAKFAEISDAHTIKHPTRRRPPMPPLN